MRKILFPVLGLMMVVMVCCNNNQAATPESNNSSYIISMEGIDSLRLQMSLDEVEKLLQAKVPLKNIGSGGFTDTIPVKYRGIDMLIYVDGDDKASATLRAIETSSGACKTAAGIGMGSDKMSVINAYTEYVKYVAPEYDPYPVRSSTKSAVAVMDSMQSRAMLFHIAGKKVVSVEVQSYFEFY